MKFDCPFPYMKIRLLKSYFKSSINKRTTPAVGCNLCASAQKGSKEYKMKMEEKFKEKKKMQRRNWHSKSFESETFTQR